MGILFRFGLYSLCPSYSSPRGGPKAAPEMCEGGSAAGRQHNLQKWAPVCKPGPAPGIHGDGQPRHSAARAGLDAKCRSRCTGRPRRGGTEGGLHHGASAAAVNTPPPGSWLSALSPRRAAQGTLLSCPQQRKEARGSSRSPARGRVCAGSLIGPPREAAPRRPVSIQHSCRNPPQQWDTEALGKGCVCG